jgi:succinate dehydrogenase/fumarate reductase-like Fe-S protein
MPSPVPKTYAGKFWDDRRVHRLWDVLLGLSENALLRCHGQANCTEVCPMELSPTDSILKLRRKSIFQLVKSAHRLDTPRAAVVA